MPVEFEVFPDHNLVYVRYQGAVVVEEVSTLLLRYRSHVDYSPHQRQLADLSRVTLVKLELPALLALAATGATGAKPACPHHNYGVLRAKRPVAGHRRKHAAVLGALPFGACFHR